MHGISPSPQFILSHFNSSRLDSSRLDSSNLDSSNLDIDVLSSIGQPSSAEIFMSDLDEWEKTQETNQQEAVAIIKIAYEKKAKSLHLDNQTFTTLPPIYPSVEFLSLHGCTYLKELKNPLPENLVVLNVGDCVELQALPASMPSTLTHLGVYNTNLSAWPDNLNLLQYLDISGCTKWKQLADSFPDKIHGFLLKELMKLRCDDSFLPRVKLRLDSINLVKDKLTSFADKWDRELREKAFDWHKISGKAGIFSDYFIGPMWKNSEARNNPTFFAEQQLHLLTQMDQHAEIREKCFDIACLAEQCNENNPLMGFLRMQEQAREMEMLTPGVPMADWLTYVSALKNKSWLDEVIRSTDYLSNAITRTGNQQQTESLLMLYFLCHQKGISLPVPYTSIGDEEAGWEKFGTESAETIKAAIIRIVNEAMPLRTAPDAHFFIQQPVWLKYLDQTYPEIGVKKAAFTEEAKRKIGVIEASDRYQKNPRKIAEDTIDEAMDPFVIINNRLKATDDLYLDVTTKLLNPGYLAICTIQ